MLSALRKYGGQYRDEGKRRGGGEGEEGAHK